MAVSPTRTALVAGATGLVGRHVLARLLADEAYGRVVSIGRRLLPHTHPKLTHHIVAFDALEDFADRLRADDVFCCLGTTMRRAGTRAAFRQVDYVYPFTLARVALGEGARQFLLVSALGAHPRSPFFYNRVKGEAEEAIAALRYEGVYLFRPSLLTGEREEHRPLERMGEVVLGGLSFLLRGPLRRYRPTPAALVAGAMVAVAKAAPGGCRVYEPPDMETVLRADPSAAR